MRQIGEQAARRQSRFSLWVVYAIVFVSYFDYQSSLPIISPYAMSLGAPVALAGLVVGMYSALNLAGNLGAGYWIDRVGRRRPLIVGLAVVGIALSCYPFVGNPYALLGLRAVHGLGASLLSPASLAYIGDAAATASRGRAMALYGSAIGLTAILAPLFSGLVRDRFGFGAVFAAVSGMMFLVLVPAVLFVGESLRSEPAQTTDTRRLLRNRSLLLSYVSAFCLLFSFGTLIVFLPLVGKEMGESSARVGLWFAAFGFAAVAAQLALGRVSDRIGREPVILIGLVVAAVALVLLPATRAWENVVGVMAVFGAGFGLLFPAMTALLADETSPQTRGTASGIYTAVYSLGAATGTGSAGALVWLEQSTGIQPFQVASTVVLVGSIWAAKTWLDRRHRSQQR